MLRYFAIPALLLLPLVAHAAPLSSCRQLFVDGGAPALLNQRLAARTSSLCYQEYAVLASGITRGALWSAEHLTAAELATARTTKRVNLFHADDNLPADDRAELADYVRSGFDRGHMTPSGDMSDATAQEESFSLANVVPQTTKLNGGIWERIESAVRGLARSAGSVYVVTGPTFQGVNLEQIGGRVLVPSATWKAVYVPSTGDAGAYLCTNTAAPTCNLISLAVLAAQVGVDPFPLLARGTKVMLGQLPMPHAPRNRQRKASRRWF